MSETSRRAAPPVSGRVGVMIQQLLDSADEIDSHDVCQITFDCKRRRVVLSVKRIAQAVVVEGQV